MAKRAYIVGAGVTGSVAGALLERRGYDVTYFDDGRPYAGTKASAGLMAPAWVHLWDKQKVKDGFALLDWLYGLRDVKLGKLTAHQVAPSVMWAARQGTLDPRTVTKVGAGWVRTADSITHVGLVYVAAGAWVNELVNLSVKVEPRQGVAFLWKGHFPEARYVPWAPFKQVKVFEREPGIVWGSDSAALKPSSWSSAREAQALLRVQKEAGFEGKKPLETILGWRPVIRGHREGLLQEVMTNTWVATGAGTSGTILAAVQAVEFYRSLKGR